MKRNLLLVTLFLAIGLVAAAPNALAQVVFGVSSNINQVRSEGTAEAVGQIVLTSSSNGTIVGGAASSMQSLINITFGTAIADPTGVSTTANVTCNPVAICTAANVVTTASGDVLTLAFQANTAISVGNTITIKGVRVNANAFGVGALDGTASASVPAADTGTNPITFTSPTSVEVANVNKLATTVTYTLSAATGLPTTPGSILTCVGASPATALFSLNVMENWNDALTSRTDEVGLAPTGVTNGSNILITLTGIPNTVTITAGTPVPCTAGSEIPCAGGNLTISAAATPVFNCLSTDCTAEFFYTVNTTNTLVIENADFPFTALSGTLPSGLIPNMITATVALTDNLPSVSTDIPFFVGTEATLDGINLSDCVTDILLPYVTNFTGAGTAADSHYDTGITIANTTLDPFASTGGGAMPQAGTCTLTLFPSNGAPGVPYTTASIPSGGQIGVTVGTVPGWAGLTGYVIGSCEFQNGHSFVSVYDNAGLGSPGIQQGYVGLILPNPSIQKRSPAGVTGAGEALGE